MTLRLHPDEIVDQSTSPLLSIAPSWERVRLGEVADVVNGAAFKSSLFNNVGRGEPLVRIRDVGRDEAQVHYDGPYEKRHVIDHGDLLIGMDGDFRVARWGGWRALLNQRVCRVAVKDPDLYDERLLLHVLQPYLDAVHAVTSSVTVKHLSSRTVRDLPIPLPPRAEQQRIVAAIEEHLSRLDAAEVAALSAERRIKALEKAIITQASSTLNPPSHWELVTVADAGSVGLGLQRSPKRHSGSNMRPYLRVANVFEDRIDDSDVMSMDMTDAEWERFKLRDGDVLLNEGQTPELLGRPAIYRGDPPEVAFTNSLIRFQANDDVDPEWALLVFRSHMHNRRFMRESQITTNIAHLAAGRFKTVEFPLPPLDEQRARVVAARAGLEACARLRGQVVAGRTRSAGLRSSILAAAFSGQLVPQDPDDEPASVLLERIRAERAAAAPTKRSRKAKAS